MEIQEIKNSIQIVSTVVELIGVLTIFFGIVFALFRFFFVLNKKQHRYTFIELRQALSKAILLGLEILIAADIMATVVTEPTLKNVAVLGLIVLIRTFLSLSLQIEVDGKFPWQKK